MMSCKYCEGGEYIYHIKMPTEFDYLELFIDEDRFRIGRKGFQDMIGIYYCPICGEELNPNGITIQHMKLSHTHYNKLIDKYDKKTVDEVIESMKNYGKLKKYKNAYLTANKWCKKRFKDKDDGWGDVG